MKATTKIAIGATAGALALTSVAAYVIDRYYIVHGLPDRHGDNPADEPRSNSIFEPEYFAVIYMKFGEQAGDPRLIARHAYFPVKPGRADDVACALEFLQTDGTSDPKSCRPYRPQSSSMGVIRRNFENLDFGSQQRIYAYVDNEDVSFNDTFPMSFTPFGAFDNPYGSGVTKRPKNKSFKEAKVQTLGNSGFEGLYVENHFRNKRGTVMRPGDDHANYSVNFNLLTCKAGMTGCDLDDPNAVIPIVIDPDMGNGLGLRP